MVPAFTPGEDDSDSTRPLGPDEHDGIRPPGSDDSDSTQPLGPDERGDIGRRGLLVGGGAVAAVAVGGLLWLGRGDDGGPEPVAETFVERVGAGAFGEANEYIHSDSPVSGAGEAAELLDAAIGLPVGRTVDAVPVAIQDSRTTATGNGRATVEVSVTVDLLVEQPEGTIPLEMRTDGGDWRVWNVAVTI